MRRLTVLLVLLVFLAGCGSSATEYIAYPINGGEVTPGTYQVPGPNGTSYTIHLQAGPPDPFVPTQEAPETPLPTPIPSTPVPQCEGRSAGVTVVGYSEPSIHSSMVARLDRSDTFFVEKAQVDNKFTDTLADDEIWLYVNMHQTLPSRYVNAWIFMDDRVQIDLDTPECWDEVEFTYINDPLPTNPPPPTDAVVPTVDATPCYVTVSVNLNMRSDDAVTGRWLATIPTGTRLQVWRLSRDGGDTWANVVYNGTQGWLAVNYNGADYGTLEGSCQF